MRRARAAVAVLFLANGAVFANTVPRFPDLKAQLELSNAAFGAAISAYGAGALVLGLAAGAAVRRWGSARVATVSSALVAANLVLLALAPSWWALALVLFVAGSLDSTADLANNAHGLRVERAYGRSILNSMHGVWSIGAVVGGSMGAAAAGLDVGLVWHLSIAAVLFAGVAVAAARFLLAGPDRDPADALAGPSDIPAGRSGAPAGLRRAGRSRTRLAAAVVVLGLLAASAQVMEDTAATWGALYLRSDVGTSAAVGGMGFIALQGMQTIGRLLGDRLVTRFGDRAVARSGATLAAAAMTAGLVVATPVPTVIAFGLVGLGIGTVIPACMRRADQLPGLPAGAGLALVGSVLRLSLFVSPAVTGVAAQVLGLWFAIATIPLVAVLAAVMAQALPAAGRARP